MKKLVNIRFEGHEDGRLQKDLFYAELINEDGTIAISATLEYIMKAIRKRGYEVEGVEIKNFNSPRVENVICTSMILTNYSHGEWGLNKRMTEFRRRMENIKKEDEKD